jgi:hypothetical protein
MGHTISGLKLSVPETMTATKAEFNQALTNVAEAANAQEATAASVEVVQRLVLERATHSGDSVFEGGMESLKALNGVNMAAFAAELPSEQKQQAQSRAASELPAEVSQQVVSGFEDRAQRGSAIPEAAEEILESAIILGAGRDSPGALEGAVETLQKAGFTADDLSLLKG